MNKNTEKELLDFIREIETGIDAIAGILDSMDSILANAASVQSVQSVKRGKGARMRKIEEPERLPDVPDWRDGAARQEADDRLTQIRLIVSSMQGESLSDIIKAILADGTDPKALAAILGVNQARISEALHGKARPKFKEIFTEVLGCDGGASVKSVKSKKRGAK